LLIELVEASPQNLDFVRIERGHELALDPNNEFLDILVDLAAIGREAQAGAAAVRFIHVTMNQPSAHQQFDGARDLERIGRGQCRKLRGRQRLMPGNGYPMRLLLPGWEGNMNVKWLRRIKLVDQPGMSYYEARTYAPILPNGKAYQFYFLQEVKSFITHPSPELKMSGAGFYEISGVAYSANGRIAKVMVTADGGKTWAEAALQDPVLPKAFTRFRLPWKWDGGPAVLQSRAWDEAGNVQPTRAEVIARRGQTKTPVTNPAAFPSQHYNGPTSWAVSQSGEITHVYA